jgi:hypothetical protein
MFLILKGVSSKKVILVRPSYSFPSLDKELGCKGGTLDVGVLIDAFLEVTELLQAPKQTIIDATRINRDNREIFPDIYNSSMCESYT